MKPNTENENRPSVSENGKTEGAVKENLVKKEPTEESKLASDDGAAVKVKVEKVPVKSEEIGRKEEIQNRALIIKQELENMKMRKVISMTYFLVTLTENNEIYEPHHGKNCFCHM